MVKLRVTADDYGAHPNIDRGIRACITSGAVNNIDVIVTLGKYSEDSIRKLLTKFEPQFRSGELTLGLHLCLSCGSPLYQENPAYLNRIAKGQKIPETGVEKYFFKYTGSGGLGMIENIEEIIDDHLTELVLEMEAQYAEFKRITNQVINGLEPSQISSHLGVYIANEEIYEASRQFCVDKNLPMRCPTLMQYDIRFHEHWKDMNQKFLPASLIKILAGKEGSKIIQWVQRKQLPAFLRDQEQGLRSTDHFVEYFFKLASMKRLSTIVEKMEAMGDRHFELVVHPVSSKSKKGLPDGISRGGLGKRHEEYRVLKSNEATAFLKSRTVRI